MCLTCEIVTWTDVCYYCCVLDYETSTFSWETLISSEGMETLTFSWEGIETLTFSWVNLILIYACERNEIWTLTSLGCGSEMHSLRWGIQKSTFPRSSKKEIAFCIKALKGLWSTDSKYSSTSIHTIILEHITNPLSLYSTPHRHHVLKYCSATCMLHFHIIYGTVRCMYPSQVPTRMTVGSSGILHATTLHLYYHL